VGTERANKTSRHSEIKTATAQENNWLPLWLLLLLRLLTAPVIACRCRCRLSAYHLSLITYQQAGPHGGADPGRAKKRAALA
jgi:hypothetical protein